MKTKALLFLMTLLVLGSTGCSKSDPPQTKAQEETAVQMFKFSGLKSEYLTNDKNVEFQITNTTTATIGYSLEAMKMETGVWEYIGPYDIEKPSMSKAVVFHELKPSQTRTIKWPLNDGLNKSLIGQFRFVAAYATDFPNNLKTVEEFSSGFVIKDK